MPPANASLIDAPTEFELALAGSHQQENAVVALGVLDLIQEHFPELTVEHVRAGLTAVSWPGRLQMLHSAENSPSLLVDCAHNVDSAQKLALALRTDYHFERLYLVLGATADKDVGGIVNSLLPLADGAFMTTSGHPRAAKPEELLELAARSGFEAKAAPTVTQAVHAAWEIAKEEDLICVTGSIFVVGDLLNQWEGLQSQLSF
jgi:dihydrofolate synthase/folylpolyglutamate synthase